MGGNARPYASGARAAPRPLPLPSQRSRSLAVRTGGVASAQLGPCRPGQRNEAQVDARGPSSTRGSRVGAEALERFRPFRPAQLVGVLAWPHVIAPEAAAEEPFHQRAVEM